MIRNKLRHYRRYFSYPLIISPLLFTSPTLVQTHPVLDGSLDIVGLFIACCGQALRLWAWGANSPIPGFRIYGPYGFVRHPLYVGNFLIALGLLIIFNTPLAYVIVLPSLALLYWSITAEEEERLEKKWGATYVEYRTQVPRFLAWRGGIVEGYQRVPFRWRQALSKEGESICGLAAGAISLEVYEEVLTHGFKGTEREMLFWLLLSLLLGLFSLVLYRRKRKKKGKARR
jgi:protein-S-isoprenylcysteine O-methyltransferase Ste14